MHTDTSFLDVLPPRDGCFVQLHRVGPFAEKSVIVLLVFSAARQQHCAHNNGGEEQHDGHCQQNDSTYKKFIFPCIIQEFLVILPQNLNNYYESKKYHYRNSRSACDGELLRTKYVANQLTMIHQNYSTSPASQGVKTDGKSIARKNGVVGKKIIKK